MKATSAPSAGPHWKGWPPRSSISTCSWNAAPRAQERRVVPETIARFIKESASKAALAMKAVNHLPHAFDPGRTPPSLKKYEREPDWKLPELANSYPRMSTDRDTAEEHSLEWVTPGHPLFEALRRHGLDCGRDAFAKGACFHSIEHEEPARLDFYRARVVGRPRSDHSRKAVHR